VYWIRSNAELWEHGDEALGYVRPGNLLISWMTINCPREVMEFMYCGWASHGSSLRAFPHLLAVSADCYRSTHCVLINKTGTISRLRLLVWLLSILTLSPPL
jgi:hypothetical protein